jgi:hypothetical protein
VLNAAARLICAARKYDHVTPLLRHLHWLRIQQRLYFLLAVIDHRCLHGTAPAYLASEFHRVANYEARRRLRSASTAALSLPRTQRSTVGDRAFPVAASRVWNGLPSSVTSAVSTVASGLPTTTGDCAVRSFVRHRVTSCEHMPDIACIASWLRLL